MIPLYGKGERISLYLKVFPSSAKLLIMSTRTFKAVSHYIHFPSRARLPDFPFFPALPVNMEQQARTRRLLPSVMMRCGTSKGLFLHRRDLPQDQSLWSNVLLSAMGSRDGDSRQLDGVGGATSTTSKVAIVSKSTRPG